MIYSLFNDLFRAQDVDTEKFGAFDGWIGYTLPLTSSSGTHDTVDQAVTYGILDDIISYHIISYHIISYHIISYYIILYHTILYYIILYYIILYYIILYYIILYCIILYYIILYYII